MPIYEYRCSHCSEEFEKIVFRENETVSCPQCGETDLQKLLSSFAVQSESPKGLDEAGPCHCGAPRRGMCQN